MSIYMKIQGITGSTTAKGFEKAIPLLGATVTTQRNVQAHSGQGANREAGVVRHSEMTISKRVDLSSCDLNTAYLKGRVFKKVEIDICHNVDAATSTFRYTLSNVMISHIDESVSDGETLPTETLSLNFTGIEKKYALKDAQGNATSPKIVGYNLETSESM